VSVTNAADDVPSVRPLASDDSAVLSEIRPPVLKSKVVVSTI
jgi:hypothetical protein